MTLRLLSLLFAPLALTAQFAPAADPPKQKGTNYAFLVGCAGYNPKVLAPIQADATVNDVIAFQNALRATGFREDHIVLMHDRQADKGGAGFAFVPERAKVVKKLDLFLAGLTPDDTVLVVLSGHGVHFKGDKTGYFCPLDADLSDKQTLLPFDGDGGLYTKLEKCKAGRKLLIANACRDAPAVPSADLAGPKIELTDEYPEAIPKGIAAVYSCEPGQRSYYDPVRGRSYFFLHLTEAWTAGGSLESVFDTTRVKTMNDVKKVEDRRQFPVVKRKYDGEWPITPWLPFADLKPLDHERLKVGKIQELDPFGDDPRSRVWKAAMPADGRALVVCTRGVVKGEDADAKQAIPPTLQVFEVATGKRVQKYELRPPVV